MAAHWATLSRFACSLSRVRRLAFLPIMTAFQNLTDQLAALAELDALLAGHGIRYWMFGGWAVDLHAGRVTREHGDIDSAVWAADPGRLTALRGSRAWMHRP